MTFPIRMKHDETVHSEEALYYVLAGNGAFQVQNTPSYRAVTRAQTLPGLLPEEEGLWLRCPRLPASLLAPVLALFRDVYQAHGGEAVVILFHQPETGRYQVAVPPQKIPGYRAWDGSWRAYLQLHYGTVERPEGYLRFGTIHSHAYADAYCSDTDCRDESQQDGLHVVYGRVDGAKPTRSAAFVVNGTRFPLIAGDVLEDCPMPSEAAPEDWLAQVERDQVSYVVRPASAAYEYDYKRGSVWGTRDD